MYRQYSAGGGGETERKVFPIQKLQIHAINSTCRFFRELFVVTHRPGNYLRLRNLTSDYCLHKSSISWNNSIQFTILHPVPHRSVLILYSHLWLSVSHVGARYIQSYRKTSAALQKVNNFYRRGLFVQCKVYLMRQYVRSFAFTGYRHDR
jgi:hypothetical protein